MTYEELKQKNKELSSSLIKFQDNPKQLAETKREIYKNKVLMYDLILQEDKTRAGESARDFMARVRAMPKMVKHGTGIGAIDRKFGGGFATGMYIQLAGESGVGKTTLLLDIICNCSEGYKSAFFNFEMGNRLLENKLSHRNLSDNQLDNLYINSDSRSLDELVMEIELLTKEGCKFFVIDSKMKIEVKENIPTHEKISKLSNTLAKLSQQRDIIIMLINQISEDDLKNKRLSLKGSGDQKYDGDIILFYIKDKEGNRILKCTKNRQDDDLFEIKLTVDANGITRGLEEMPIETEYVSMSNSNDFLGGIAG